MSKTRILAAILATFSITSSLRAVTVPYTEDFAAGNANWLDFSNNSFLTPVASGGPDDSSYASGTRNFNATADGSTLVIFRANSTTPPPVFAPASGGAFVGNWIAADAVRLSAYVRHNAPVPVSYFARISDVPSPGMIFADSNVVQPNTWTPISFWISPNNPTIQGEGVPFDQVLDNIGRVQIGAISSSALSAINQAFTFDIDQVHLTTPEPTSLVTAGVAAFAGCFIRCRSR